MGDLKSIWVTLKHLCSYLGLLGTVRSPLQQLLTKTVMPSTHPLPGFLHSPVRKRGSHIIIDCQSPRKHSSSFIPSLLYVKCGNDDSGKVALPKQIEHWGRGWEVTRVSQLRACSSLASHGISHCSLLYLSCPIPPFSDLWSVSSFLTNPPCFYHSKLRNSEKKEQSLEQN